MVPLLMMLVLLPGKSRLLATARSDKAPMLPSLVRVAVPPFELRITPAAGRAKNVLEPTPVSCHPPFTDTPCATLTATLPPGVPGSPLLIALIPVLNCPVVETLLSASTCTVPVVEAAQMPCATAPCVVIAPDAVTMMFPPGSAGAPCVALRIVPLSATMPSASAPLVVIGPDEAIVMPPLLMPGPPPLRARARMPICQRSVCSHPTRSSARSGISVSIPSSSTQPSEPERCRRARARCCRGRLSRSWRAVFASAVMGRSGKPRARGSCSTISAGGDHQRDRQWIASQRHEQDRQSTTASGRRSNTGRFQGTLTTSDR
jgi:hypothetical protein